MLEGAMRFNVLLLLAAVLVPAAEPSWISFPDPRLPVSGLAWLNEHPAQLMRFPPRLEKVLPRAVWGLAQSPSGGRIRFRTNTNRLAIRLEYPSAPNMANMHAFGQTGVDLYLDGAYVSTAIAPKDAAPDKPVEHVYFDYGARPPATREVTLYLPLYKAVKVLAVGVDGDAVMTPPSPFALAQPVVFYGTSITQGGCASRSGLSYQAILARRLNLDFVNLGFSGNGKGEAVVADAVAEIGASAFVLDFAQNNGTLAALTPVYEAFLAKLREKHPRTPILAITPIATSVERPEWELMRAHIREVVKRRVAAGDQRLTLVEGYDLLGPNLLDGLVDGVHPNDIGFQAMAEGLVPALRQALALPPELLDDRRLLLTSAGVEARRGELIRFLWGSGGWPRALALRKRASASPIQGLRHARDVEELTVRMEAGETNVTHHYRPQRPKRELVVVHHGHSCTFDDLRDPRTYGMGRLVDELLGAGYGVLTVSMPHLRPGDCKTMPHGEIFRLPVSGGSPLKFFLEPVAVSLNSLRAQYRQIHMTGLSGGGWATTVYAALDPSIRMSIPIAGSIPLYLRTGGSVGDEEQFHEAFYRLAGYPDLYLMGSTGAGRRQLQILNRRDDCCFGERQHNAARAPYEAAYRVYEAAVQKAGGAFRLELDETATRHEVSAWAARRIVEVLGAAQ